VRRYIQDRTVIEDTESSVDLVAKGWELTNYPERLSYSATPPDFGALVIQRRRWANVASSSSPSSCATSGAAAGWGRRSCVRTTSRRSPG
jgi:cellulose synthase/poly-beta-1,6-N-acetylglucosamine synthase-like glycosyltransferase